MADATSPTLLRPSTTLTTDLRAWKGKSFRTRKFDKPTKQATDLEKEFVNGAQEPIDEDATVDTSTIGEFFIDLDAQIQTLLKLPTLKPLDLNVDWVPFKIGDYYVFTGPISTGSLVRFETLTFDDSGATLVLSFGSDLTVGAARVIVARLTSGTISVADSVLSGAGGEITLVAGVANQEDGANNRSPGIGGRLKLTSTGAAHSSQTSIPVSYNAEGSKPTS